jgi:hypothetical protein
MTDVSPTYRPIADHLPAVYQEDADSWEQVRGYLGLVDDLYRSYLMALDDLTTWLSPDALRIDPPGHPDAAGRVLANRAVFEQLADWFAYTFPPSWETDDARQTLGRREAFLRLAARLWRRRGTPAGFFEWFCFYFDLTQKAERPWLLEHFKYRPAADNLTVGLTAADDDHYSQRITLLVPRTSAFDDYRRRQELHHFVAREAPAHLVMRVCWVPPDFVLDVSDAPVVRKALDSLVGFVPLMDALVLDAPPAGHPRPYRLGEGQLPGGGRIGP